GYSIWYKRLESGTFETLRAVADGQSRELDSTELSLLASRTDLRRCDSRPGCEDRTALLIAIKLDGVYAGHAAASWLMLGCSLAFAVGRTRWLGDRHVPCGRSARAAQVPPY
ncbi:MAG: hypothetical protein ACKOJF_06835, partial [Planctomycetaceae bacterium]